jgi:RND superfamily putative drug exporter
MFRGIGRAVVHHPVVTIVVWLVAAVGLAMTAPKLQSTSDQSAFLPKHYESIQAIDVQQKAFPQQGNVGAIMVFSRADGGPLTSSDSQQAQQIATKLGDEHINRVTSINATVTPGQSLSKNHLVQTATVYMPKQSNFSDNSFTDAIKKLRNDAKPLLAGTDLKMGMTGNYAQALDQQNAEGSGQQIVFFASFLLIILLLVLIFRSVVVAVLPLLTVLIAFVAANGLIADANKALNLNADSSINTLLIVVMLGVGTDYILFLLFRYRERLRMGEDKKTAMVEAVARVGEVIASAAGVVMIAFLAMTLSSLSFLRSMGPSLAISVFVALLAGLTLVPAVVSLFGQKVFWPAKKWQQEPKAARAARTGQALARKPAVFALVSGLVLVALGLGAFGFKANYDFGSSSIPKTAESIVAQNTMEKGFPAGNTDPTYIYLTSTNGAPISQGTAAEFGAKLGQVPGVGDVSAPKGNAGPNATAASTYFFTASLKNTPESAAAMDTVKGPLRSTAHADAPPGTKALVGGSTSVYVDFNAAMDRDYTVVFPVAGVLIMLVLALLLRSLVAPWYLMASVALGFMATLGSAVILFQKIGHQSQGLISFLPVILYMFVVALGTDYNILMVSRLREEAKAGHPPRQAAAIAMRHSLPTIAAAGVILAGSLGTLALSNNSQMQQMGFTIGFGILVAAFVMAMFFTPSLTALIGHAAWWPGHADRANGKGNGKRGDEPEYALSQQQGR